MPDFSSYGAQPDTGRATPRTKLHNALAWCRKGFEVFPLAPNSRKPREGSKGFYEATTDEAQIRAWWAENQDYNIGCRPPPGVLIVDLDVKEGRDGIENWRKLGGEIGGLTVRTTTGGLHVYLTYDSDLVNTAGSLATGVDTRGRAGYAVAPGSTIDGVAYALESDGPMRPAPAFIAERIRQRGAHTTGTRTKYAIDDDLPRSVLEGIAFAQRHEPATSGRWHELGFKAGCELCRLGVSLPTALDILRDHWIPRGTGFKSDEQFQRDVAGGYEDARQKGEHGSKSSEAHLLCLKDVPVEMPPDIPPDDHEQHEQADGKATPEPRWKALDFADFMAMELPPVEMILSPWLPTRGIAMVCAERGVGKTWVGLNAAYAIATGGTFLRWQASKPCRVLYIDGEMDPKELQERFAEIVKAGGVQPQHLTILPMMLHTQRHNMNLADPADQEFLRPYLKDVDVLMLDNISSLSKAVENKEEEWAPIGQFLLEQRRAGRSNIFFHHTSKAGFQRGTSKREDNLNSALMLSRPSGYTPEEGARFVVEYAKARGFHGKDAAPFEAHLTPTGWACRDKGQELIDTVLAMHGEGHSISEIAKEVKKSDRTIYRYIMEGNRKEQEAKAAQRPIDNTFNAQSAFGANVVDFRAARQAVDTSNVLAPEAQEQTSTPPVVEREDPLEMFRQAGGAWRNKVAAFVAGKASVALEEVTAGLSIQANSKAANELPNVLRGLGWEHKRLVDPVLKRKTARWWAPKTPPQ